MIRRFALYGFLKNQRYFEPFLLLAFLEKGLTFALIGLLIGFREICVNLLEIPTGAVSDVLGRRWTMICSHVAYVAAFLTFGFSDSVLILFAAMFAFSIGEAFRTGTHKAIIFGWLSHEGRQDEKTKTYGYTRSWSQIGSAVSVLIAAALVFFLQEYTVIFWISAIPASLNIVNFLTYPKYLDGHAKRERSVRAVASALFGGIKYCVFRRDLRRLLLESMGFEGTYKAGKDYLQPLVLEMALVLPVFVAISATRRTALMLGLIYAALHLLGSVASRQADTLRLRLDDERRATRAIWLAAAATFGVLLLGTVTPWIGLGIVAFVVLGLLQNLWRPLIVGRIADQTPEETMATVLSVESQAKALWAAVAAPLLGLLVDVMPEEYRFAPVAILGLIVTFGALMAYGHDQ